MTAGYNYRDRHIAHKLHIIFIVTNRSETVATLLPIISHIEADNVMAKNELSLLIQKTKSIYLATVMEEINSHRTNQQKN